MRILFLQKRILFPTDAGNKVRTLNVIRHLARWHDVTYLCNLQPEEEQFRTKMTDLGVTLETIPWREVPRRSPRFFVDLAANLFSRYPFNVNKDYDPALRQRAIELLQQHEFDLVVCDFVQMARNVLGLTTPPMVLFQHNVEAEIFKRHSQVDKGWLRRRYMGIQWRKMRRFECEAGRAFDRVIAVSERDQGIYQRDYNWDHVDVIDTAVNTDFFQPQQTEEIANQVVFVGSLDWLPNEGGVKWFVDHIWRQIRDKKPTATFQIVGRNPAAVVRQLDSVEGVEVVGTVDDVRPYIAQAQVMVVPLLVGGGTRLKIYEAMAMRKAVVSTTLGAEGLDVSDGKNISLADDSDAFADRILNLLDDSTLRSQMATAALDLVVNNYSSEAVARQFEGICHRITKQPPLSKSDQHRSDEIAFV